MVQTTRYSFPDCIFLKPFVYLIAALLLLDLAAVAVLGEIRTAAREEPNEAIRETVSAQVQIRDEAEVATNAEVVLDKSADRGQEYIDSMVFFGESTTAHLRSRGVLLGGRSSCQVWANESNTMMLSTEICKQKIIYPETGERMTVAQAAAKKHPEYLVFAFGVNGLSRFVANPSTYALSYAKLISAIHKTSPGTTVLLQTVYPVARQYPDAARVNADIEKLNTILPDIAAANGAYLVDTASVLRDEDGMLRAEYAMEDGLHLTVQAYAEILQYLRTHGCP